jgi:hypothetical protein
MKITGVDNDTYSLTGEAFSHIASPNSTSATPRKLQEDDVALGKLHSDTALRFAYAARACSYLAQNFSSNASFWRGGT